MSFPHHAAYVLDMRMAKTPERVTSFLYDLQKKLQSLKDDDIRLFLQYKREDVGPFCFTVIKIERDFLEEVISL